MEVSVLVSVKNEGDEFLKDALLSLTKQTFTDFEILMDSTPGLAKSRNILADKAKGKYLAFLDADDEFMPLKLEIQHNAMEMTKSEISFTYTYKTKSLGLHHSLTMWMHHPYIAMSSLMVTKHLFEQIRFDETLKTGEDYDFILKAWLRGNRPLEIPVALVDTRVHSKQMSNDVNSSYYKAISLYRNKKYMDSMYELYYRYPLEQFEKRILPIIKAKWSSR